MTSEPSAAGAVGAGGMDSEPSASMADRGAGVSRPSPARIALVLGLATGGTGRHVRMLAAGLTARGAQVTVCGPASVEPLFGFAGTGAGFAPVEIADRPRPARDLAAVRRLRRVLLGSRAPGVVHAHGLRAGALAGLALRPSGARSRQQARRPAFVVTLHNAPPGPGVPGVIYAVLERIVARRADTVLCVSGDLEERIRRRGARRCARAVVPAAAPEPAAPEPAAPEPMTPVLPPGPRSGPPPRPGLRTELGAEGRPLVLAAGRLAPQKGLGTLLDAAARWRGRRPGPLVLVAGDGPLATLLATRIATERLPARLLGHRSDLPALMAAADVLVLPSIWEGQPLFIQEALRTATPLVATRVGGVPDLTGEDAALLVPPADPDALAAAILRVLGDERLRQRLVKAARARARSLPSARDAIDAVLDEYRRVAQVPLP